MAVKITDLPAETSVSDDDYIIVRDNATGTTKKITRTNFFANPPIANGAITNAMLGTGVVEKDNLESNARINTRVTSTANSSSLTPNSATTDILAVTALAGNMTINAPSGSPVDGQALLFRFKDNGSNRTLTWNAIYRAIGVTIPTATTAGKTMYISVRYNTADSKWDVLSVGREA